MPSRDWTGRRQRSSSVIALATTRWSQRDEGSLGPVAREAAIDLDERLLGNVLRQAHVPHRPKGDVQDQAAIPLHESAEGRECHDFQASSMLSCTPSSAS